MAEQLQLFGFRSGPFSLRVEIALKLKGVDYEHIEEDLLNNNKSDLLLKYNPVFKKVPVLVHNGNPILESLVILEYIEEIWTQNPIFSHDPYHKSLARFWAKYMDDKVLPMILKVAKSKEEEREKAIEEGQETLEPLEKELGNKKFFFGDEIGFVDIVGIVIACWIPASEEALGFELLTSHKFPRLKAWSEEFVNHSVVKLVLPQKDVLVAFLKNVTFNPKFNIPKN